MAALGDRGATNLGLQALDVTPAARAALKGHRPGVLWFTGLPGSGKSTIANLAERRLHALGFHTVLLDGDNVRHGLNRDLGFTDDDRRENMRRVAEIAKLFADAGLVVIASFISPFRAERSTARERIGRDAFAEVFIDAPAALCRARDPKGLWARAAAGRLRNFTGVDSPYEPPDSPDLRLDTAARPADDLAARVADLVVRRWRASN